MNILSKLSIRNLKLNKKRTISTIIGIILSVALICAVASMAISFQATLVENAINESGYYHIELMNVKENEIKDIENNRDVKEIHSVRRCGYAKLEGSKNKEKPYVKLSSMDHETFEKLSFNLIEGNFPQNSNEVVINNTIKTDAKVNYKIGDTIFLEVGERKTLEDEQIVNTTKYSFKIVGIIERPSANFEGDGEVGYTIIGTGMNQGENDLYVSLQSPKNYKTSIPELLGVQTYGEVQANEAGTSYEYKVNEELLRWEAFAFSDTTVSMLFSAIGVVLFVIVFTSVFCIRNSFAIATTEKIKMYSMLASVGTTKKQIRKNVMTEALILGMIGIPFGILAGIFAVLVLIKIVNALLGEYLLSHVNGIVFKISILPILVSVVLGAFTIYLSARSSAKKASKVSPIEGLRSSKDIKINSKKLKVPKVISKIFKTGGELAYKNLKRSKKKYRTTVISISISIFTFITMNAFITNAFDLSDDYYQTCNYNMQISRISKLTKEEINQIVSQQNIEQYSLLYEIEDDTFKIKDSTKINPSINVEGDMGLNISAIDSEAFKRYAKEIGLKYEEVKGSGILCDEFKNYDKTTGKQKVERVYTYSKGDTIEGEYLDNKVSIQVGAVSNIKPDGMKRTSYDGGSLIVEEGSIKNINFRLYGIVIQSNHVSQLEQDLKSLNGAISIFNLEDAIKEENAMVLVIKIFLYGFIAVITLIGVTNIFNTITSNMELRQKEFAMLKSIGMTKLEFNRMINLETIFYGTKSFLYGTILGLLGTFAIYQAFSVKIEQGIYIPINPIIISAVFVFIFVFAIMRYSIKKMNQQNMIETIRKENV